MAWQVLIALSIDFGRPVQQLLTDRIQHRQVTHVHFGFSIFLLYCEGVSPVDLHLDFSRTAKSY